LSAIPGISENNNLPPAACAHRSGWPV